MIMCSSLSYIARIMTATKRQHIHEKESTDRSTECLSVAAETNEEITSQNNGRDTHAYKSTQ